MIGALYSKYRFLIEGEIDVIDAVKPYKMVSDDIYLQVFDSRDKKRFSGSEYEGLTPIRIDVQKIKEYIKE